MLVMTIILMSSGQSFSVAMLWGSKIAGIGNIPSKQNIFEPMILPRQRSFCCLTWQNIAVHSSGRLVPIAIMVRPTKKSFISSFLAITCAVCIIQYEPKIMMAILVIMIAVCIIICANEGGGVFTSSSLLVCCCGFKK